MRNIHASSGFDSRSPAWRRRSPGSEAASPSQKAPRVHERTDTDAEELLLSAEAGASVPAGMERCVVLGGGFSGVGEEFGLVRFRTPHGERDAEDLHAVPCSINPWGEVGMLRVPQREREIQIDAEPLEIPEPIANYRKRWAEEEAEKERERNRAYQAEIERRIRQRLEESEDRRDHENAENLASLFNRLGSKWGVIQEEKIEARRREIALAHFQLQRIEKKRREQAAIKLQSWWRMLLQKWRYRILLAKHRKRIAAQRLHKHELSVRKKAANDIKRVWKGWRQRLRYRELRAMIIEDRMGRRMRKNELWNAMQARKKEQVKIQVAKKSYKVLYSVRAAVRIQAWLRGWIARREVRRAWLLREKWDGDVVEEIERLRRMQREAVHTVSELTGHKDMNLITRTVKRQEIEDNERLKDDLRKVREVARTVEAQNESELDMASKVVPLKELTDFLEARQLRMERDKAREDADYALMRGVPGTAALHDAMDRERKLQEDLANKKAEVDLYELRREVRRIHRDMAELTDGTSIFGRLQEIRHLPLT